MEFKILDISVGMKSRSQIDIQMEFQTGMGVCFETYGTVKLRNRRKVPFLGRRYGNKIRLFFADLLY
jgi:hypothetical protein